MADTDAVRVREVRIGDVLAGRYKIMEHLGRGGAGAVFVAIQEPLGRRVALKVVRSDLQDSARAEFEARFLREAALAGRLSHPNVVTVHDFGTTEQGTQFVVMELLGGRTLKEAMSEGPMDLREAARISIGVAAGLRHAHSQGLIHRDVKPSNIFLVRDDDGRERPMLLDFGLVKDVHDTQQTRTGTYLGTPMYMAPEQSKGTRDIDGRADLYALGCVLFHLVAGQPPFQSDNPLGLALLHLKEPVPRLEPLRGEPVPAALEAVVRRLMAKEPAHRYSDGTAVVQALEDWLAASHQGVDMGSEPAKRERKVLWFVGLGAVGLVVLVGVGALTVAGLGGAWIFLGHTDDPAPMPEPALVVLEPIEPVDAVAPHDDPVEPSDSDAAAEAPHPMESPAHPVAHVAEPVPPPPPRPEPPPVEPEPAPAPAASADAVVVDNVAFEPEHAARALEWVNTARSTELYEGGVYRRGITVITENRPFASLEDLADTPYIAEKTMRAIYEHTQ